MRQIEERVTQLLTTQFKVAGTQIGPEVTLGELAFDSLVLIELGLVLDKEFGVEIAEGELLGDLTIGDLVRLLDGKLAAV